MKLYSNHMYLVPFGSPYYALIPKRRWYAPWIWDLNCVEWLELCGMSGIRPLASKLRRAEVIGLMLMLGVYKNQTMFEKFLKDRR